MMFISWLSTFAKDWRTTLSLLWVKEAMNLHKKISDFGLLNTLRAHPDMVEKACREVHTQLTKRQYALNALMFVAIKFYQLFSRGRSIGFNQLRQTLSYQDVVAFSDQLVRYATVLADQEKTEWVSLKNGKTHMLSIDACVNIHLIELIKQVLDINQRCGVVTTGLEQWLAEQNDQLMDDSVMTTEKSVLWFINTFYFRKNRERRLVEVVNTICTQTPRTEEEVKQLSGYHILVLDKSSPQPNPLQTMIWNKAWECANQSDVETIDFSELDELVARVGKELNQCTNSLDEESKFACDYGWKAIVNQLEIYCQTLVQAKKSSIEKNQTLGSIEPPPYESTARVFFRGMLTKYDESKSLQRNCDALKLALDRLVPPNPNHLPKQSVKGINRGLKALTKFIISRNIGETVDKIQRMVIHNEIKPLTNREKKSLSYLFENLEKGASAVLRFSGYKAPDGLFHLLSLKDLLTAAFVNPKKPRPLAPLPTPQVLKESCTQVDPSFLLTLIAVMMQQPQFQANLVNWLTPNQSVRDQSPEPHHNHLFSDQDKISRGGTAALLTILDAYASLKKVETSLTQNPSQSMNHLVSGVSNVFMGTYLAIQTSVLCMVLGFKASSVKNLWSKDNPNPYLDVIKTTGSQMFTSEKLWVGVMSRFKKNQSLFFLPEVAFIWIYLLIPSLLKLYLPKSQAHYQKAYSQLTYQEAYGLYQVGLNTVGGLMSSLLNDQERKLSPLGKDGLKVLTAYSENQLDLAASPQVTQALSHVITQGVTVLYDARFQSTLDDLGVYQQIIQQLPVLALMLPWLNQHMKSISQINHDQQEILAVNLVKTVNDYLVTGDFTEMFKQASDLFIPLDLPATNDPVMIDQAVQGVSTVAAWVLSKPRVLTGYTIGDQSLNNAIHQLIEQKSTSNDNNHANQPDDQPNDQPGLIERIMASIRRFFSRVMGWWTQRFTKKKPAQPTQEKLPEISSTSTASEVKSQKPESGVRRAKRALGLKREVTRPHSKATGRKRGG